MKPLTFLAAPAVCNGTLRRAPVCGALSALAPLALSHARRSYYWPYPEDFVPAGAQPSRFQSSPVPSVRERVIREYAFAPLFGSRAACCVLGLALPPRRALAVKAPLRELLGDMLGAPVELGPLREAKHMALHRPEPAGAYDGTAPRLGDAGRLGQTRLTAYARQPAVAFTTVEVFLADPADSDHSTPPPASAAAAGSRDDYADDMDGGAAARTQGEGVRRLFYSGELGDGLRAAEAAEDALTVGDLAEMAAELHGLGVVSCEVPRADESGFVFDRLNGAEVDGAAEERVVERWARRLEMMELALAEAGATAAANSPEPAP